MYRATINNAQCVAIFVFCVHFVIGKATVTWIRPRCKQRAGLGCGKGAKSFAAMKASFSMRAHTAAMFPKAVSGDARDEKELLYPLSDVTGCERNGGSNSAHIANPLR